MSEHTAFQYATVRYVHDTTTGEFLNVGLVLFAPDALTFRSKVQTRYGRLAEAFPNLDGEFYRRYVERLQTRFDEISARVADPQTEIDRFPAQLEALLQTVLTDGDDSIRLGPRFSGAADDLEATFQRLYGRLVTAHLKTEDRESRNDNEVWQVFRRPLNELDVIHRLRSHQIDTGVEVFAFPAAWKNGKWNVMQAVSLDLVQPASIRRKAREWLGAAQILGTTDELGRLYLLVGEAQSSDHKVQKAFSDAVRMLSERALNLPIRVIREQEAAEFAAEIAPEVLADTDAESLNAAFITRDDANIN